MDRIGADNDCIGRTLRPLAKLFSTLCHNALAPMVGRPAQTEILCKADPRANHPKIALPSFQEAVPLDSGIGILNGQDGDSVVIWYIISTSFA